MHTWIAVVVGVAAGGFALVAPANAQEPPVWTIEDDIVHTAGSYEGATLAVSPNASFV